MEELKIDELYELMEQADSIINPKREEVEEINYKLRKFLEILLVKSNYDYELLDIYYQVGENYEDIKRSPRRGLERIKSIMLAIAARVDKLT